MKTCTTCLNQKELSDFHRDLSTKDGLSYKCKECRKEQRSNNKRRRSDRHKLSETRTDKPCTRCKIIKPLKDFCGNSRSIDGTTGICRECHRKVQNKWYHSINKIDRVIKKNEAKLYFASQRGGSCEDCGLTPSETWPMECFDFHHVGKKSFDVARVLNIVSKKSMQKLEKELKKCVFVCANCHRRRHSVAHKENRINDQDANATSTQPAFVTVESPPA